MNTIYEQRLSQKNSLIAELAEDLQDCQRIIDNQKYDIMKLNNEIANKGRGRKRTVMLWTVQFRQAKTSICI